MLIFDGNIANEPYEIQSVHADFQKDSGHFGDLPTFARCKCFCYRSGAFDSINTGASNASASRRKNVLEIGRSFVEFGGIFGVQR